MSKKDEAWSAKLKITVLSLFTVIFAVILCVCVESFPATPSVSSPQTTYTFSDEKTSENETESTNIVSEEKADTVNTVSEETVSTEESESETQSKENEEDSGNYVYITDTGTKYHRHGCSYLKSSSHKITIEKAKSSGKTPCSKCKP